MNTNKNLEYRNVNEFTPDTELRHISGYAIVFDSLSEDLGYYEVIERGAVTQELLDNSDIFCVLNHDDNKVLARWNKGIGSLSLTLDEKGLKYEFDAANTQVGNDLIEYIKRGEINASSFCFALDEDDPEAQTWELKDGVYFRTIHKIAYLHDVSPVWTPAYSETSVAKRYLDKFEAEEKKKLIDLLDSKLQEIENLNI